MMRLVRSCLICSVLVACSSVALFAQEKPEERPAWAQTAIDEAKALFDAGKFEEGIARYEAAAKEAEEKGKAHWEWQFWMWVGTQWYARGKLDQALAAWERSLAIAEQAAPDSLDVAGSLNNIGVVYKERGDPDRALEYYEKAVAIRERLAPDSLRLAMSVSNIGILYRERGDLERALEHYQKALAIKERLAPDSLDVATSLNNVGLVYYDRGDLDRALEYYEKALAIRERLVPDSLEEANSLLLIGYVYAWRRDLDRAAECYRRSLAITERLAPDSLDVAVRLGGMGFVCRLRGDLGRALEYCTRALAISQRWGSDTLELAWTLKEIGIVHHARGDLERALEYEEKGLAIYERLAPGTLELARSLHDIGVIHLSRGDLDGALEYYRRDLAISQRLAPDSLDVAYTLYSIGVVHHLCGDADRALECFERSRRINERLAPDSLGVVHSWNGIGLAREMQGDPIGAVTAFASAAGVLGRGRQRAGVQSTRTALLVEHRGPFRGLVRLLTALHESRRAVEWLEKGRARAFADQLAERSVDLSAGAPEELVTEQRRLDNERNRLQARLIEAAGKGDEEAEKQARWDLTQLQTKQEALEVRIRNEAPAYAALEYPEPLDVEGMREALDPGTLVLAYSVDSEATYVFALAASDERTATGPGEDARATRGAVRAGRSRSQGRRVADESAPTRGAGGPTVAKIEMAEEDLRGRVLRLRGLVGKRRPVEGALRALGELLLGPVREEIEKAERVLVLPDGPLHYVPFHALPYDEKGQRVLGLEKPVHYCQSMTVYDIVRKQALTPALSQGEREGALTPALSQGEREGTLTPALSQGERGDGQRAGWGPQTSPIRPLQLLAFGDPVYPGAKGDKAAGRSVHGTSRYRQLLRERSQERRQARRPVTAEQLTRSYFADRGYSFVRLPQSGDEVDVLGGLFAPEAKVLKGEEATEEAVKGQCGEARYVHFACHGYLDARRGMESALVLSLPRRAGRAKENGFLQAYEVFGLKLNADLVTLSACETGLGEEMAGEGIIGLTRAFMYAGTPSVVVSLWRVSDESTSLFMQSFYGHLKAGDTKGVALRKAMQELRANPKYAHPFFWAPFVLVGDYR